MICDEMTNNHGIYLFIKRAASLSLSSRMMAEGVGINSSLRPNSESGHLGPETIHSRVYSSRSKTGVSQRILVIC